MTAPINVALAGIGGYGKHYLDALFGDARATGVRFVGVVEPSASPVEQLDLVRRHGVPVFPDLESLFAASRIDLMMLATPIHLHAEQTHFAVAYGAHVLCEKPLGGDLIDAIRMLEADRDSGKVIAVGYQWSFSAAVQSLKADIRRGRFGRPLRFRTICNFPRPRSYFTRNAWAGRLRTAEGAAVFDSPANNATAHYLHNMFFVLGRLWNTAATPASVQAELYRANAIENCDTAAMRCTGDDGVEMLYLSTLASDRRDGPRFEFEFEQAIVRYDFETTGHIVAETTSRQRIDYGNPNHDRHGNIWQCVDAVKAGRREVACGVEASLAQSVAVEAMHESCPQIGQFDPADLTNSTCDDGPMVSVRGLDDVLKRCFRHGRLPSELPGVSWGRPGRAVATAGRVEKIEAARGDRPRATRPTVSTWVRPAVPSPQVVLNRGGST